MADTKLSAIATQLSSPAATDRLFAVDDPGGTPSDAYLLWSQIMASGDINEHRVNTESIEIGDNAHGNYQVVIGRGANPSANDGEVVIGRNAVTDGGSSTAVGLSARADALWAAAFGASADAGGSQALAMGYLANASQTGAISIGASSDATGIQSVAVGGGAQATATDATAIGNSATASGNFSTAIGQGATAGLQAVAVGENAQANATYATAIGEDASASSSCTSIGRNAQTTGTGNVAVGRDALANHASGESIAAGYDAHAEAWRTTAIGRGAHATATSSTALGWGAYVTQVHSVALGRGSENTIHANSVELGGEGQRDIFFGVGSKHKYTERITSTVMDKAPSTNPVTLHGPDAYDETGSPTNDIAGGDLQIAGGRGTGTAIGGKVTIQGAPAGGVSNNTKNSLIDIAQFDLSGTAGHTRFLIYDVDNGQLERVTVGAADSGGSGYKLLRIAN